MKSLWSVIIVLVFMCMSTTSYAASATLSWTGNTESDLKGYKVYRGNGECTTGPLKPLMIGGVHVEIAKPATTYTDTTVPVFDGMLCYEITAIDTSGNESPRSNRATKAVNLVPPQAPAGLAVGIVMP